MEKRETYKDVELSGRKWRIEKFDALTGSYIAYKVMTQFIGSGIDAKLDLPEMSNIPGFPSVPTAQRPTMSKADFMELQRDCLSVCYEVQEVNGVGVTIPVLTAGGAWGVGGVEHNTILVMMLTVHALMHNIKGFFDVAALKELTASISGMFPFNAKI